MVNFLSQLIIRTKNVVYDSLYKLKKTVKFIWTKTDFFVNKVHVAVYRHFSENLNKISWCFSEKHLFSYFYICSYVCVGILSSLVDVNAWLVVIQAYLFYLIEEFQLIGYLITCDLLPLIFFITFTSYNIYNQLCCEIFFVWLDLQGTCDRYTILLFTGEKCR